MEFIEIFSCHKYKQGNENVVADALSCKYAFPPSLNARLFEFEFIKDLYASNPNLASVYNAPKKVAFDKFYRQVDTCFN